VTVTMTPPASIVQSPVRAIIRCFGRFQVLAPDGSSIKWRTTKAEELLAYLVHHRGEAVDRTRIMEALWSHAPNDTSAYLNTTAYYLRKSLSSAGIANVLEHNKGYYRIRLEGFDSHLLSFEQALSTSSTLQEGAEEVWEKASKLYTGGYLADNHYDWSEQRQTLLENGYVELVMRINGYYKEAGRHSDRIRLLKKALRQVSWNEAVHMELISSFLANRDRLGAMKQYDALKRMLRREYNVEPGDEIKKLLCLRY
jgi:LuxR family transcriptional regulator, maltose regulon positive regulatory protein